MSAGGPEALPLEGLDRLERAVREGRLADFRVQAEAFEQELDVAALRRRLEQDPAQARALLDRLARLEATLSYTAAVTQALSAVGVVEPEAYGPTARSANGPPPRLRVEA